MSFKIVCTYEKSGVNFSVVPEAWENNGVLFWPGHLSRKERENLRCNPLSKPSSDWSQQTCIVKVKDISLFLDALNEEKKFAEFSDTDAEER